MLLEAFENHFSMDQINQWKGDVFKTEEKSHGRMETRIHIVSDVFDEFVNLSYDWKGLTSLGVVMSARIDGDEFNADDITIRYYISSAELTPEKLASPLRDHWQVENGLHWKRDCAMSEGECRIRRNDGAEILAGLRHVAVNLLNNTKTFKADLKRKQKKAAISTRYLFEVLAGQGLS